MSTIAAIATAPGRGGVAVIRVSGPEAFNIATKLTGKVPVVGRISYVTISSSTGELIDRAIMLAFKSPASYTGEDVIEFQTHGGSVTPKRVLEASFNAGARLARRGEFTERAFLNGKLDLSEAESVIELVDAKTERAANDALLGLSGKRKQKYKELYEAALKLSTSVEHLLDFDEGELPDNFVRDLEQDVGKLRERIGETLKRAREGKLLREGALVVLVGKPNAGKSSLLNALLGENRAIVSNIPGTTRDTIEEGYNINGWPIRLVDTAGLRDTRDAIEAEGVRRSRDLMDKADIIIALDEEVDGAINIHAKCDLDLEPNNSRLRVSAKTGEGLDSLKQKIEARLEALCGKSDGEPSASEREASLLSSAYHALPENLGDLVCSANSLRDASDALGKLIGAVYSEDLLTSLFSNFCIGK